MVSQLMNGNVFNFELFFLSSVIDSFLIALELSNLFVQLYLLTCWLLVSNTWLHNYYQFCLDSFRQINLRSVGKYRPTLTFPSRNILATALRTEEVRILISIATVTLIQIISIHLPSSPSQVQPHVISIFVSITRGHLPRGISGVIIIIPWCNRTWTASYTMDTIDPNF